VRLETENLAKRFGGVDALVDVSLDFPSGTTTAIIGPNGAGKSTLFNVVAGYLPPDSGEVYLWPDHSNALEARERITQLPPHLLARKGLGILFQDVRVFEGLTALENVAVSYRGQRDEQPLFGLLRPHSAAQIEKTAREKAHEYLDFVGLSDKMHLWAGQLSYGQQKLVALARLLATEAQVLLLDEPTAGVHPEMVDRILGLIRKLTDGDGRTVVMIEHNLNVVRSVGDWVYLMAAGRIEVFGKPGEVLRDRTLLEVFPTL
jgi:ABC-type branched-subunit amino acid transport system ATPase component